MSEPLYQKWLLEVRGKLIQLRGTGGDALIGTSVATDSITRLYYADGYDSAQAAARILLSTIEGEVPNNFIPHSIRTDNPHRVTAAQLDVNDRVDFTGNLVLARAHLLMHVRMTGPADTSLSFDLTGINDQDTWTVERAPGAGVPRFVGFTPIISHPNSHAAIDVNGIVEITYVAGAAGVNGGLPYLAFRGETLP
jgi:hypothetical protein